MKPASTILHLGKEIVESASPYSILARSWLTGLTLEGLDPISPYSIPANWVGTKTSKWNQTCDLTWVKCSCWDRRTKFWDSPRTFYLAIMVLPNNSSIGVQYRTKHRFSIVSSITCRYTHRDNVRWMYHRKHLAIVRWLKKYVCSLLEVVHSDAVPPISLRPASGIVTAWQYSYGRSPMNTKFFSINDQRIHMDRVRWIAVIAAPSAALSKLWNPKLHGEHRS